MSNWLRLAQDAAEAQFGGMASVRPPLRWPGRIVIRVEVEGPIADQVSGINRTVRALAGGPDVTSAWDMLLHVLWRPDHRLTTNEVAAVLGVSDSRVRQLVMAGTLVPDELGSHNRAARFLPHAVYQLAKRTVS